MENDDILSDYFHQKKRIFYNFLVMITKGF